MVLDKYCPVSPADWEDLIEFLGAGDGTQFGGRRRWECAYVVYTDGTYYYAEKATTGKITYGGPNSEGTVSGTDADAVWNAALANTGVSDGETRYVNGCGMTYPINATIVIPSNVWILNAAFTLIDNSDTHMIESFGFAGHTGNNHWYVDTQSVTYNIGLVNVNLYGNKANQASGYGIRFYAKRYFIKNVIVRDCKEIGFYSECGNVTGQHDWRDLPESIIDALTVRNCDGNGIVYRGPHDGHFLTVNTALNGGLGAIFEHSAGVYAGACYVEHLHAYSNTGNGIELATNVFASRLVSETHTGSTDIVISGNNCKADLVSCFGSAIGLQITGNYNHISQVYNYSHTNLSIDIQGDHNTLGIVRFFSATNGGVLVSGQANTVEYLRGDTVAASYVYRSTAIANKLGFIETWTGVQDAVQIDNHFNQVLGGFIEGVAGDVLTLGVTQLVMGCYVNLAANPGYTNLVNYFAGGSNNEVHAVSNTTGGEVIVATSNPAVSDYFDCRQAGAAATRTKNRGTATIPNLAANVVVAHGLFTTPTKILCTGTHTEVDRLFVTAVGVANFTINAGGGAVTGNRDVYWEAIV